MIIPGRKRDDIVIGRSTQMICLAMLVAGFACWLAIASATYTNSTLLALVGLCSGAAGWFVGVASGSIAVSQDGVSLRNVLRTIQIPTHEVYRLDARSGLCIHTRAGEAFRVQAFPPSLFASMTGNKRARRFATSIRPILDLDDTFSTCSQPAGVPDKDSKKSVVQIRATTPILVVSGATFGIMLTLALHALT